MVITTKALSIDEWPEWRSLRLAALVDAPGAFGSGLADWSDAPDQRWRSRLRDVPLNVIAHLDGEPVGQVSGTETETGVVELISMWVAPHARGVGVGDALIGSVVSWARSRGASRVELDVKKSNDPARRLYERNRFTIVGKGGADDEVRMARPVDRAAAK